MRRREALRWLGLGTGAAVLAACQAAPAASPPAPANSQAANQPRTGGTLRVGRSDDLVSLDGAFFIGNVLGTTYGTVYERLIDYDDKLTPRPMLAESWEFSSDAKQLKFNLRKGVTWHTGREFSSADVKWNLERIRDPKVGTGTFAPFSAWFQSVETPDKNTVILHLDPPRPAALDVFEILNMLDPETMSGPNAQKTAVGTGPFTFGEWAQGQYIRFNSNKNYWQSGRPYLDAVEVDITNDPQALVVRLESGGVDAISDPPLTELLRLKADPNYQTVLTYPSYYQVQVNNEPPGTVPILQDKRVRQALNLAIDRQRFVGTVLRGLSEPWNLPWPAYSEAAEPAKQAATAFDLDKARALLRDAGVSSAELDIVHRSTDGELVQFVQIYQADLAKIGIKLNIKPLETAVWQRTTNSKQYQLSADTSAFAQYHPSTLFSTSSVRNFGGVDEASVTAMSTEPDESKRRKLYSQMNDFILDQSLNMVIGQTQRALVFPQRVHGLTRMVNQVTGYTDTWLSS